LAYIIPPIPPMPLGLNFVLLAGVFGVPIPGF
jgi:hypothetical protein